LNKDYGRGHVKVFTIFDCYRCCFTYCGRRGVN